MHILIDNQKSVEVTPTTLADSNGIETEVLSLDDVERVIKTWAQLDIARRGYRTGSNVGDGSNGDPHEIHIAWVSSAGELELNTLDPHWDDLHDTVNGYAITTLDLALPEGAMKWGAAIGEPTA